MGLKWSKHSNLGAFITAIAALGGVFLLCTLVAPSPGGAAAYLFFLIPVGLVATTGRWQVGLGTLAIAFVISNWFFIAPRFQWHLSSADDWVNLGGYSVIGLGMLWLGRPRDSLVPSPRPERTAALQQPSEAAADKAALANALQQLESLSFVVSHDLRAPLRAIKGFTNALREDYGHLYDQEGKDYAKRVVEGVNRMEAMLAALLAWSRIGRGELAVEKIELESQLASLSKQWHPQMQARDAQLEIVRPLPAVMANSALCEQALSELLVNALKFVPEGTVPHLQIHTQHFDGLVRITFVDNGIGIEERNFPKLFQVFQRLNASERFPGVGMGLAIVRKACERMGGRAGVESEPGKGSRFWIELPKAD
jgi:signal transduction histidine kinase